MIVWNDLLPAQRVSVFESGMDLAETDLSLGEQRRRRAGVLEDRQHRGRTLAQIPQGWLVSGERAADAWVCLEQERGFEIHESAAVEVGDLAMQMSGGGSPDGCVAL